jgi:HK97 family phage major capsid protein
VAEIIVRGRLGEIRARQTAINSGLTDLETADETDDTRLRADALLDEFQSLEEEAEPLVARAEAIARVRATMAAEAEQEQGTDTGASDTIRRMQGSTGPDLAIRQNLDPFRGLEEVRLGLVTPGEVRSRAMFAVEKYTKRADQYSLPADGAARCEELINKNGVEFGTNIGRQLLATGSEEYLAAFQNYLNDPGGYSARAALSLVSANGGYLVPFTLDPTIILTNAGSANPYRRIANVKTTTTNNWNGVTSAGVSAAWTAEGIEAADNSPTVGPLVITPQKATAYLFGSFEILGDSDFAAQLPGLLADAKDRIEETAFAVGTGGTQPNGVVPRGTVLAQGAGSLATLKSSDVYNLQAALPARFRGPGANNVWLGNLAIINQARNTPAFATSLIPIVNDSTGQPTMLGKPFLESTSIAVPVTTAKSLVYLDGNQFYIVDRVGMSIVYDPIVIGGVSRIPTGQGAWYSFWRTGSDVSTATAVRVLSMLT